MTARLPPGPQLLAVAGSGSTPYKRAPPGQLCLHVNTFLANTGTMDCAVTATGLSL